MSSRLLLLLVGFSFFLGGCSMAPPYLRPTAPIPAQWPQGDAYKGAQAAGTPTVQELSRQEFFADPQLQKLIGLALENNRDLRLAILNVERARALYGIQKTELFPAVNAVAAGGKQRRSTDLIAPGNSRTVEQYGVNLGITAWEIDFFGRIRSLKDQALEAYLATEEAHRGAQIALVAEVARGYLSLAADRENLQLAQSTLETQQRAYHLVSKLLDAGMGTELDVHRAQVPVATARGAVASFSQRVAQDQNALTLLVGTAVPKSMLPAALSSVTAPAAISAGLSSTVLLRRPDIVAAEHRIKGAYALIGAARAAFFPRIALTSTIGTASSQLSGLFNAGSGTWSFAPQIVMPIFDARVWAAYRVSKAQREIVLTQYEKTIQTAFREVADALAVQGTIDEQLAAQQALVDTVDVIYNLAQKRYKAGLDSYLSVLDAQQTHYAAQQQLVSLRLAKLANRVRLYAVLGGGGEE